MFSLVKMVQAFDLGLLYFLVCSALFKQRSMLLLFKYVLYVALGIFATHKIREFAKFMTRHEAKFMSRQTQTNLTNSTDYM